MTGTGRLIRLILRRDRFLLPLWTILLGVVPAGYAASFAGLFPTDAERIRYAAVSAGNAGFRALYGPLHGSSLGELSAWRAGFLPVLIGLCALLTVIRHTRADEEAGRTDLLGAAAISRHAPLAAALLTTACASVLLGLVTTAAMLSRGLPLAGSLVFGASFTVSGWAFAAIGAVAAQLTSGARSARSIAALVLAAAFLLRVAGDGASRFSPIGWATHAFPYGANDPWPLLLAGAFSLAAAVAAIALRSRRDLGDGLFPARPGRPAAAAWLRTPLALAFRLHRGLLIGWTIGFASLGLVFGAVGGSVVSLAGDSAAMTGIFTRLGGTATLADNYFAAVAAISGLIAACYAVQATLRLRDEEQTGHAEAILSTPSSRLAWAASHLLFALLGPALILLVEGTLSGLTSPAGDTGRILAAALVQLPAVWVLAGVAVLLVGALPRHAALAWAGPALCLLVLLGAGAFRLSQKILDLSPFTHVPHLPGAPLTATSLSMLTGLALLLTAAGLAALRRRDIAP